MNANATFLGLVVDHSGSMTGIASESTSAINTFIREQVAEPGELTLLLNHFDTTFETVYGPGQASEFGGYTLQPRGLTALNDGIGQTIEQMGSYLSAIPEADRPGKVILVIVTDGGENASVEFPGENGRQKIKSMIDRQESTYSWNVVFLASNIDASSAASGYGISRSAQTHNTGQAVGATYANLSRSISNYRGSNSNIFAAPSSVDADGNDVDGNSTLSAPRTRNAPADTRLPRNRSLLSS